MAFESLDVEKINVLDSEFSWLNSADIIKKWKNYIHDTEDEKSNKNFSDWENAINSLWNDRLGLRKYSKALEFMMNISTTLNSSFVSKIAETRANLASNNSDDVQSRNNEIEYYLLLKEIFSQEKDKFVRRYKNDFSEKFWKGAFNDVFYDIVELVLSYYRNFDIAKIFWDAPYNKLYDEDILSSEKLIHSWEKFAKNAWEWHNSIIFVSWRNQLWLRWYQNALCIMMKIDYILNNNLHSIIDENTTMDQILSDLETKKDGYNDLAESIKKSFFQYIEEFKMAFVKDYWKRFFDSMFSEIVECALNNYKYGVISNICRDALEELKDEKEAKNE